MPPADGLDAPDRASPSTTSTVAPPTWWYARFRIPRDPDDAVQSHVDLLIANRIIAPVLDAYGDDLPLWRFHRRWPRDPTGHQFSFIFMAPAAVARSIDANIAADPMLARLRDDGLLREYRLDAASPEQSGDVAATSDARWSPAMQSAWPMFIMGASRMWLTLVTDAVGGAQSQDIYTHYREAEQAIDALWFEQGNHALFHHLSALFGYKPLQVKTIMTEVLTF